MNKFTDCVERADLQMDMETDRNGGAISTGYVNMELYDHVVFILEAGGLGADISWQARQATQDDDGGSDVKNISGATATHTNGTDENSSKVISQCLWYVASSRKAALAPMTHSLVSQLFCSVVRRLATV